MTAILLWSYKNCKQFRLKIKTKGSPSYSCTFVLKQVLVFGEKLFIHISIVKQCHVKSANLDFHKGNENDNPITIYMPLRLNLFLVYMRKIFFHFPICHVVATILDFQ